MWSLCDGVGDVAIAMLPVLFDVDACRVDGVLRDATDLFFAMFTERFFGMGPMVAGFSPLSSKCPCGLP